MNRSPLGQICPFVRFTPRKFCHECARAQRRLCLAQIRSLPCSTLSATLQAQEMNPGELRETLPQPPAPYRAAHHAQRGKAAGRTSRTAAVRPLKILALSYPSLPHCTNPTLCTWKRFRIDSASISTLLHMLHRKGKL